MAAMIESETSEHFVVITNEIQWQGSAGSLLKRDAFDGQVKPPQRELTFSSLPLTTERTR